MSDEQLKTLIGRSVTISVPATVANLGAGYDVLALALDYRNELTVRVSGLAQRWTAAMNLPSAYRALRFRVPLGISPSL